MGSLQFSSPRSFNPSLNMFSTSIIHQALASADVAPAIASSLLNRIRFGIPCTSGGRITKTRKSCFGNSHASSIFHPHVLASEHLHYWVTHALSHHNHVSQIPPSTASILMEVMLSSLEPKTYSNYGTGLLHFNQFFDQLGIPEHD